MASVLTFNLEGIVQSLEPRFVDFEGEELKKQLRPYLSTFLPVAPSSSIEVVATFIDNAMHAKTPKIARELLTDAIIEQPLDARNHTFRLLRELGAKVPHVQRR